MLTALAEAIDRVELGSDPDELIEALFAADRLWAKIAVAAGEVRSNESYRLAGYGSLPGLLRGRAGLTRREASELSTLGSKLRSMKVVADAWADSTLCGGQVKAIAAIVPKRHSERFENNEAAVVDSVIGLTTAETVTVMRNWVERADAMADQPEPEVSEQSECFFTELLDGAHDLKGSFGSEDSQLIGKALEEATREDPNLTAPQRRAQALTDICDFYLSYHGKLTPRQTANRERPHLNIGVDLDRVRRGEPGHYVGRELPAPVGLVGRLLCDANLHRYLFDERSALLDYGRAQRSAPVELFQALLARDGGCRGGVYDPRRGTIVPCDRLGEDCQAHHLRWWEAGGQTSADNMALLCRQCHRRVHADKIELELEPDGLLRFRRPDGVMFTTRPRSQLPRPPVDLPVWRPFAQPKPHYDDYYD